MSESNEQASPYAQRPWLQIYPAQAKPHLEYSDVSLPRLLEKSVHEFGERTATNFFGARLTYLELLTEVNRLARILADLGVEKGDRVAIMLPNCPQAVIAYYGALRLGAVVVATNPLYVERELEFQLEDSGTETIIVLDLFYSRVKAVKERTHLKHVIVTKLQEYMPFPLKFFFPLKMKREGKVPHVEREQGVHFWEERMQVTQGPTPSANVKASDLALLQYTGGTTGVAKGAMLTHRNLVANVLQVKEWMLDAEPGKEKMLGVLPFFHVYGMTVAMNLAVTLGAELIILPKFEIKQALKAINKYQPTFFPGAPTMYVAINTYPEVTKYKISSIRSCISGSAPLPVEVQEKFEQLTGGKLVEGYGLTEASPVTHSNPLAGMRKTGTIGLPLPDTECKIVDPATFAEVAVGEIGELAVKGPQVMAGYWNRQKATAAAIHDGWLLTGDMATMDEDGYFRIADRKKDLIIAGGFNIYPRESEEGLYQQPAVQEAAVIGVPDDYRGETVKAFLVLRPGEQANAEEITKYCRSKLAAYKVPRLIEFREELPKTIVGKVLKRQLRQEEKD
ncbi:MAG: long-chain fatty acid--CoA ligase [Firmicutes bacterium]|nr:long-chain fatty acid--CoA ligase [Bacillota bacterium]